MSDRPITTGETAKARSMPAFSTDFPRKSWRTSASAHTSPRAAARSPYLALMSGPPARERGNADDHHERQQQQDDGDGRRCGHVVRLDLPENEDRRDLGLEGDVARNEDDRAELAERAREAERRPREDRRHEVRK